MAILYLDTSALVKLYVRETGTEHLLQLAHPDTGNQLALLSLSRIEFRAALRRRARLGDIDSASADELIRNFGIHLSSVFQMQPLNEAVFDAANGLIDRRQLRAYDALQLAGCQVLQVSLGQETEIQFVCADQELIEAARSEGMVVIHPGS